MKRRNFFSKIAKGLLGIGIVTALPTPEVETVLSETPQNLSAIQLDWSVPVQTPAGMVEIGNELYIVESDDSNKALTYSSIGIDHKHTVTGLESGKEYIFGVRPGKSK